MGSAPQIPWLRVFVEGVVIVGSILLAFGIDAWWEERQERAEEQQILHGLHQEFIENRAQLALPLDGVMEAQQNLEWFLSLTPEDAGQLRADSTTVFRVVEPLFRAFTSAMSTGFFDATVSSGKLALIEDPGLRAAIARTESLGEDLGEMTRTSQDLSVEATKLLAHYREIQNGPARPSLTPLGGATLRALRSDDDLMAVAAAKRAAWDPYLVELRRLASHMDDVVAMIETAVD